MGESGGEAGSLEAAEGLRMVAAAGCVARSGEGSTWHADHANGRERAHSGNDAYSCQHFRDLKKLPCRQAGTEIPVLAR